MVYRKPAVHKLCQGVKGNLKNIVYFGVIVLCAFFSCAGIQMIEQDTGVLQMELFRPDHEKFLAFELDEQADEQLSELSRTSGAAYEKLLAAVMLKHQYEPGSRISGGEILSDVLGYERRDETAFLKIASYYKSVFGCVEYLPLANLYDSREKRLFDAREHMEQISFTKQVTESGTRDDQLLIPVEEKWKEIVPVICMKTGTVVYCSGSEKILCLELEEGIQVVYGNLKQDQVEWNPGNRAESGQIIGSAAGTGLLLQFRLRAEDGTWLVFDGTSSMRHGEKTVRSVTLQSPLP